MNKWKTFYKILKIPENVIEPDYYDIFNLSPETCNKEMVDNALREIRIKLRQHIPSAKFVPFVLQFENEVLEPAANILRDELDRITYNKKLQTEKHTHKKKLELVNKIKKILDEKLDENGMLDSTGKAALKKQLRDINVLERDIDKILHRIPEPETTKDITDDQVMEFFTNSVILSASQGTSDTNDIEHFMELASQLNLPNESATSIIESHLSHIGNEPNQKTSQNLGQGEVQLIQENKTNETNEQSSLYGEDEISQEEVEKILRAGMIHEESNLKKHIPIIIITAIAILSIFLIIISINSLKNKTNPKPVNQQKTQPTNTQKQALTPEKIQPTQTTENNNTSQPINITKPQTDRSIFSNEYDKPEKTQATSVIKLYKIKNNDSPDKMLEDIAILYSITSNQSKIDPNYVSTNKYTNKMSSRNETLDNIEKLITKKYTISFSDNGKAISPTRLKMLKQQLESNDNTQTLNALHELCRSQTPTAFDIALDHINYIIDNLQNRSQLNKALRILEETQSPYIAKKIAELMGSTQKSSTAHQLQMSLIRMTSINPPHSQAFGLRNTIEERQYASAWWQANTIKMNPQSQNDELTQARQLVKLQYLDKMQLYAAIAYFANNIKTQIDSLPTLKNETLQSENYFSNLPQSLKSSKEVFTAEYLINSTQNLGAELEKISRLNINDNKFSLNLDIENLQYRTSIALCKTQLQKIYTELRHSNNLMKIIISHLDPTKDLNNTINQIQTQLSSKQINILKDIRIQALIQYELTAILNNLPQTISTKDGGSKNAQ